MKNKLLLKKTRDALPRKKGAPRAPRPCDLATKLRRIRTELGFMLAAVSDGLERIEHEPRQGEIHEP